MTTGTAIAHITGRDTVDLSLEFDLNLNEAAGPLDSFLRRLKQYFLTTRQRLICVAPQLLLCYYLSADSSRDTPFHPSSQPVV